MKSEVVLKLFNAFYCEGCKVKYLLIANDESSIVELTIKGRAFITHHDIPVVFFEEKSGYYSIEPKHLIYPPFHLCYKRSDIPEIVALSDDDAENYSGRCEYNDENNVCNYCGDCPKTITQRPAPLTHFF